MRKPLTVLGLVTLAVAAGVGLVLADTTFVDDDLLVTGGVIVGGDENDTPEPDTLVFKGDGPNTVRFGSDDNYIQGMKNPYWNGLIVRSGAAVSLQDLGLDGATSVVEGQVYLGSEVGGFSGAWLTSIDGASVTAIDSATEEVQAGVSVEPDGDIVVRIGD